MQGLALQSQRLAQPHLQGLASSEQPRRQLPLASGDFPRVLPGALALQQIPAQPLLPPLENPSVPQLQQLEQQVVCLEPLGRQIRGLVLAMQ